MSDFAVVLVKLTGYEIKHGLDRCMAECPAPPCPAEFYQLAKSASMHSGVNGDAYRVIPSMPRLAHKRSEAAKLEALKHLAAAKASVRGEASG